MPVRNEAPATKKAPEAPKRVRGEASPTTEKTKPAAAAKAPEPKVIQKSILEEKAKKFIAEVNPEYVDKINDILERQVLDKESNEKDNVVFVAFSPNGPDDEDVDDKFNVEVIKDCLFAYHTLPEKAKSGKQLVIEVMPPAESTPDAPHMLIFHEVS